MEDYSLDEGSVSPYPFSHESIYADFRDRVDEVDEVTIGIGVVAEGGKWVILGSDMRASWPKNPKLSPNDECGKQWDLPKPFDCAVSVAGILSVAQPFVGDLSSELEKLASEEEIQIGHVENAIEQARFLTHRRRVDWELRASYCFTLDQWITGKIPGGKMNRLIHDAGKALIASSPLPVEIILGGFVRGKLLFYKASGKRNLEIGSSPTVFVIGAGGELAMDVLNKRGQHVDCSLPRSLLHVAEALEAAEKEPKKTVGKTKRLFVVHEENGMGQFDLESDLMIGWKKAYASRPSTQSLQENSIARTQATQQLLRYSRRCITRANR